MKFLQQLLNVLTGKAMCDERAGKFSFDDYLAMRELAFEWADSYDCKDWERLAAICDKTLHIDYTEVNGSEYKAISQEQFVKLMSHPGFLGDQLVQTQHLLGASKWEQISPNEVYGYHQIRAAHQRYTGPDKVQVENKGHGHALVKHTYKKINGSWKLAGLKPSVRWNEFAFDKIFLYFDPDAVMKPTALRPDKVTGSATHANESA